MNDNATADTAQHQAILTQHAQSLRRRRGLLALLMVLLVLAVGLDLMTGPAGLSWQEILTGLRGQGDARLNVIMWQVRVPTAILAVLVGAALSLAGAEMQTILGNPLASPFTLGVSSAAAFGAALAIILGVTLPFVPQSMAVPINAFIMAFGAVMLIQLFAASQRGPAALVLFGIALVFGFNALVAIVQFLAPADSLQQLVFWTMGSLNRANVSAITALFLTLAIVVPFAFRAANALTLLSLGQERAQSLGIHIERLRFGCLLRASLLAAVAVSFTGTIGFIGLVGPHIAKMLLGEDHHYFLPGALLSGALLMSLASIASKTLLPGILLPIGIVASLLGLPCFIILLLLRKVD